MEQLEGISWEVPVNEELALGMLRAQNDAYIRKLGIACAFICGFWTIGGVIAIAYAAGAGTLDATLSGEGTNNVVLGIVVFFALTAFGLFSAVHPGAITRMRCRHDIKPLRDLLAGENDGASLTITLGKAGVTCDNGHGVIALPYAAFSGKMMVDGTPYLITGAKRDQSLLYNLAGVNWALREESFLALPIPQSVLRAHPRLEGAILDTGFMQERALRRKDPEETETVKAFLERATSQRP